MRKSHMFANPVTNKFHNQIFFVHTSHDEKKKKKKKSGCRVFKKMWYVISKCLNTRGRIGSTVESSLSNLNRTEKWLNHQKIVYNVEIV
jgi:hypothetical protein